MFRHSTSCCGEYSLDLKDSSILCCLRISNISIMKNIRSILSQVIPGIIKNSRKIYANNLRHLHIYCHSSFFLLNGEDINIACNVKEKIIIPYMKSIVKELQQHCCITEWCCCNPYKRRIGAFVMSFKVDRINSLSLLH